MSVSNEINAVCSDSFWNSNLTWNSESPDFTQCFQQVVLVMLPCLLFGLTAVINILISQKSSIPLPWTFLNILKIVLTMALLITSTAKLILEYYDKIINQNIPDIVVYATCIKIIAFVFVLIVMFRNRLTATTTSTVLFMFWLSLSLCSIVVLRSTILNLFYTKSMDYSSHNFVCEMISLLLIFSQLFLSLFHDKTTGHLLELQNPFDTVSFLSFVTLFWVRTLMWKGYKSLLTLDEFPPLPKRIRGCYLWRAFSPLWTKELANKKIIVAHKESTNVQLPSLAWTLIKTFWPWVVWCHVLMLASTFCLFLRPLLLDELITYISNEEYVWKGYLLAVSIFIVDLLARIFQNMSLLYSTGFAFQIRSTLFSALYRKVLKLSSSTQRDYTTGEVANLASIDIDRIYYFSSLCTFLTTAPIKILVIIGLLWKYLGIACLPGVGVLILLTGLNYLASKKIHDMQKLQLGAKDERLKFMTEILNGIKILKLYAWEIPFMKQVTKIRHKEVNYLRAFRLFFSINVFVWGTTSFSVAIACFVTYLFINDKNSLDPNTLFVSLTLLTTLKYAVYDLPELTADLVQVIVSVKRFCKYLASEERNEKEIGICPDEGMVISAKQATFSWSLKGEPCVKNLTFHVARGSLVTIIGPVGSGKSSIISAILGNMYKIDGSLNLKGTIAYVPQQAWILNKTVKDNIIFVKPMHRTKYDTVVSACCLKPDLEILPAGDNTEIGEKGVNLSGGQKQRVSLARAVYHNADVYLLDDPLSAVDSHVGKHLFDQVIGRNGLLKNKTRILVTHNISMLSESDLVITIKNGEIEEMGTYNELMSHQGFFTELIKEYSNLPDASGDSSDIVIMPNTSKLLKRSVSCLSVKSNISVDSKLLDDSLGRLVEDEGMEIGEVKRVQFVTYARHMNFALLFLVALGIVAYEGLEIGGNIWLSKWSNDASVGNSTETRSYWIEVYAVFGVSQSVCAAAYSVILAIGAARASRKFHIYLLESIMKAPMSFFDSTPLGRIINRFGQDINNIDTEIPQQIDVLLDCSFIVLGSVLLIGCNVPIFFPFLIPIFVACYWIQKFYLVTSRQLKRLGSVTLSPILSHLSESIQGVTSINAYNISETFIKTAENKVDDNCSCVFQWACCNRWLNYHLSLTGDFMLLISTLLVVYYKGILNPATSGLIVTYALSITQNIVFLTRSATEMETKVVSVERVAEYSNLKPEAPWNMSDTYPSSSWPSRGLIEFRDYSTRYRENLDLVLKDICLTISPSEKLGIVGRTGAGKSSFALALFRVIEPVSGTIVIDDVDICLIGLHELRSKLTIIPQDPVLFTGPLRMNLDPHQEYSDDEIWQSLEQANLKTHIQSLPDGLTHEIAEGGGNLSVGQRQLTCLARALLKKSKIIILDEATAAVDVETDRLIQNTIRSEFKEHTVITIAHRLNTIMDYDRVIVMDGGRISESGSPTELLQNGNSNFYSMARDAGLF